MRVVEDLLSVLRDEDVLDVRIGLHWTTVVVGANDDRRCGLASTILEHHEHHGTADINDAGTLDQKTGKQLASLALSNPGAGTSVGIAAINALIPSHPELWQDGNAEEIIAHEGRGKTVVVIGDFPFSTRLRQKVLDLVVFDNQLREGVQPKSMMAEIVPTAEVVAITGMTLINHTLEQILALCSQTATKIIVGPSTPLSPVLYDHGIDILCGSVVVDVDSVVKTASQGATFRQLRRAGIRLVSMAHK